jgi:hypothetical protein
MMNTERATSIALWRREWLASSRLARTPWLVALAGVALGAVLLLAGMSYDAASGDIGRRLFHVCFSVTTMFVTLFGPAIAANAVALEREGRTWDALIMAGVEPRAIDRGKFLGAYSHLGLYVLGLVPAFGVPHLFGGVGFTETLLAIVMVAGIGALAVRFGLLLSSMVSSTRAALLVTLCASAALCFFVGVVAVAATSALRFEPHMDVLERDGGPVFWPVALVHGRFGFDYARHLLVVPLGGFVIGWFGLRELTVYALGPNARTRPHRLSYLALLSALAVLLGTLVTHEAARAPAMAAFSAVSFAGIIVVGGDRPSRARLAFRPATILRSVVLLASGTLGLFLILAVGAFVRSMRLPDDYGSVSNDRVVENMLLYAPAFSVFVVGLIAVLRTTNARTIAVRGLAVLITLAVTLLPVFAAIFGKAVGNDGEAPLAFSPIGVVVTNDNRILVLFAAVLWAALGAILLAVAHAREQRA